MEEIETLEAFYKRKFDWMPANIRNEIGHFNLLQLEPLDPKVTNALPYKRRDYYKIMMIVGDVEMHYADKVVKINKPTLVFSNPQIPYKCEGLENIRGGYYCIFNDYFFHKYGNLNQYSVFQVNQDRIFDLEKDQLDFVNNQFKKMFEEINSNYIHKYDVLRNLVLELIHFAIKMKPAASFEKRQINASERISSLFLELVERQFPIDENHPKIKYRSANDFAEQLNVHVNHLNRVLKKTTFKTTTQIIAERILQESKILLKHSN